MRTLIIMIILLIPALSLSRGNVSCTYEESELLTRDGYTRFILTCSEDVIINKDRKSILYMKYGNAVFDQSNSAGMIVEEVHPDFIPAYISRRKSKIIKMRLPKEGDEYPQPYSE